MKEDLPATPAAAAAARLPLPLLDAVDTWRRLHGNPSRASYIRKAIEAELARDGLLETNAA